MIEGSRNDDTRLPLTTPDPLAQRAERLRELIPEAFVEGRVDFDRLRQALGDLVNEGRERYGLSWAGMKTTLFNLINRRRFMAKLNQIIAVCAGKKSHATAAITALYHTAQKEALFSGLSKSYRPKDEEGERLPGESQKVQATVGGLISSFRDTLTELWDVVATQELSNTTARADIVVDGTVIVRDVPVTTLLFIEKQLNDVKTFVEKLPVLASSDDWTFNEEADCYATKMRETTRTKKVPRNHIKYEATKEHPAQVEMYTEDILVGYWQTVSFSGAIPATEKNGILSRLRLLSDAVKSAREAANGTEATESRVGRSLFDFIFGSESAV